MTIHSTSPKVSPLLPGFIILFLLAILGGGYAFAVKNSMIGASVLIVGIIGAGFCIYKILQKSS
jgi:hypothetical protein